MCVDAQAGNRAVGLRDQDFVQAQARAADSRQQTFVAELRSWAWAQEAAYRACEIPKQRIELARSLLSSRALLGLCVGVEIRGLQ